jgi:hypothetical protein
MKNRFKIRPLYGTKPYAHRSSQGEADTAAICGAAHHNIERCVHDRQTGSLRVYDPQRRRWFCQP